MRVSWFQFSVGRIWLALLESIGNLQPNHLCWRDGGITTQTRLPGAHPGGHRERGPLWPWWNPKRGLVHWFLSAVHTKRAMRVCRHSYIVAKEKKKMSCSRQELSNNCRRGATHINFASVILDNVNLPACHMLMGFSVQVLQVSISLSQPASTSLSLLGFCLWLSIGSSFIILLGLQTDRVQETIAINSRGPTAETREITEGMGSAHLWPPAVSDRISAGFWLLLQGPPTSHDMLPRFVLGIRGMGAESGSHPAQTYSDTKSQMKENCVPYQKEMGKCWIRNNY